MRTFRHYFFSPLLTLLFLIVIEYAERFDWFTPTLALPFFALAIGTLYGSRIGANLAAASLIVGYSWLHFDQSRTLQLALSAYGVALVSGWRTYQLHQYQQLSVAINGNYRRLVLALDTTSLLITDWHNLPDPDRLTRVREIQSILGNLAALILGWLSIGKEIKIIKESVHLEE